MAKDKKKPKAGNKTGPKTRPQPKNTYKKKNTK